MRALQWLLLFIPMAFYAKVANLGDLIVFAASALAIIPLAGTLGEATEALAEKTGPRIGGLLNATFGNAAELIITLVAIHAGQMQLVRASITGSILGNLLPGPGLCHALRRPQERPADVRPPPCRYRCHHDHSGPDRHERALSLQPLHPNGQAACEELSLTTAGAMLILYVLFIVYTLEELHFGKM